MILAGEFSEGQECDTMSLRRSPLKGQGLFGVKSGIKWHLVGVYLRCQMVWTVDYGTERFCLMEIVIFEDLT